MKVYKETNGNGTGTMGWVSYNHKIAQLFDTMPEELLELTYDKNFQFVVFKKKAFLYNNRNELYKSNKFLIKNNCAFIIDTKKEWYKIYFYHTQWKISTIMWIKAEDVRVLDGGIKYPTTLMSETHYH